VIEREKQRKLLGGGAIADGTTDAKNASVDGPLNSVPGLPDIWGAIRQAFLICTEEGAI
jgi:hypothetical protein